MEKEKDWKQLKSYRCPMRGCGFPLRQFNNPDMTQNCIHTCTSDTCGFEITDRRLSQITVIRHKKLEPPDFIQELRNQEELNNL